jgi:hypothetical protein
MIFYFHVSEAVVLAQESQSPPRYFVVATEIIFGLWCNFATFHSHLLGDGAISRYCL